MRRFFAGRDSQCGQAIVLVAITMMGMLMMVGLAIDAGQLYAARRTMQEAADAGAYAGAVVLYQQGTQAEALSAATADVTLNGYTHNVNGYTVVVREPMSGPFSGNPLYVEVIIEGYVRTALVPAQSVLSLVRVRAVAGSEPLNNEYAIMALNRGNTPCAFRTTGNTSDIHLRDGGILVNSSSSTAACNLQTSATRFTIDPNPPHGVDVNGNSASTWPAGMDVDTGHPQQADPFAGFPKPSTSCIPDVTPCTPMTVHNAIPATKILDPGVYTVTVVGTGNDTLILRPGIYVLKAGTNGSGNSNLISADPLSVPPCVSNCGVFLFNTHSNYPGPKGPTDTCGPLNLTGNGSSRLAPMSTGTYAGFLIYQDPACTNGMTISGNGSFTGSGTIYLPSANFTLDGNNATLTGSQLVANTVVVGTGNLTINFAAGNSAQPILPRLAE